MNYIKKLNHLKPSFLTSIIILCTILFLILYSINRYLKSKLEIKEHYLTYFLPFYSAEANQLYRFYENDDDKKNFFKQKFEKNRIVFASDTTATGLMNNFVKVLLQATNIVNTATIQINKKEELFGAVIQEKVNYIIASLPILEYFQNILNYQNLRLISVLNSMYLYFITKKKYQVFDINRIPIGFKIGILSDPNEIDFLFDKLMDDLDYKPSDYQKFIYKTKDEMFKDFVDSKIDMIIFFDTYPNLSIQRLIDDNFGEEIILLPFSTPQEEKFLKRNRTLKKDTIDLNLLAQSYFPKKFGNNIYTMFRPNLTILKTYNCILGHDNNNSQNSYEIMKYLYEFRRYINSIFTQDLLINDIQAENYNVQILLFDKGSHQYLVDKGYISFNDNPDCVNLVGSMECTNENLKNNGYFVQEYYNEKKPLKISM